MVFHTMQHLNNILIISIKLDIYLILNVPDINKCEENDKLLWYVCDNV